MKRLSKTVCVRQLVKRKQAKRPKVVKRQLKDISKRFGLGRWQMLTDLPD